MSSLNKSNPTNDLYILHSQYHGCRWLCDTRSQGIVSNHDINSLAPGKFEWYFRYAIFKWILVIDGSGISCEIALVWMSLDFTDDQSTLVQVMAWCRQATSHYLSQCWPRSLSPYGVIRPQWVNLVYPRIFQFQQQKGLVILVSYCLCNWYCTSNDFQLIANVNHKSNHFSWGCILPYVFSADFVDAVPFSEGSRHSSRGRGISPSGQSQNKERQATPSPHGSSG